VAERDPFAELERKYGIQGYDNSNIIVSYDVFKSLVEKAEKLEKVEAEWLEASIIYARKLQEHQIHFKELQSRLEAVKKALKAFEDELNKAKSQWDQLMAYRHLAEKIREACKS